MGPDIPSASDLELNRRGRRSGRRRGYGIERSIDDGRSGVATGQEALVLTTEGIRPTGSLAPTNGPGMQDFSPYRGNRSSGRIELSLHKEPKNLKEAS